MSEKSFLWTTGGAGDGATTYTRTDWSNIIKVIGACHGFEGVAPSFLNTFAATPSANNVSIASGAGVVDGKPYLNDAAVNVTIPSAVGGGNTRIDRIVLRADWTAQTVRITRIAGTDAASPTPPAITQTPGTTYDIMLFQVTVDTSGNVTVTTDERVWARIANTDIAAAAAIAYSKLALSGGIVNADIHASAAVALSKLASVVPAVIKRMGGSATNWLNGAPQNTYTPSAVIAQVGAARVTVQINQSTGTVSVTFPQAFGDVPLILWSQIYQTDNRSVNAYLSSVSATGFTINVGVSFMPAEDIYYTFGWIAMHDN